MFVHGCFWHAHTDCIRATLPKRNQQFWKAKFVANRRRDQIALMRLRGMGFRVAVVWECELRRGIRAASCIARLTQAR